MAIPDREIHPVATGAAKTIVDAHQKEEALKFYSGWFCPFVQRAWTVLEEKKIPYQYIEVNPYDKPKNLIDLNPRGLVPTIDYEGKPLYESTVMCEFLEEAYPDHTPHLLPKDVYDRARTRIWTDFTTSRITPAFFRFIQHQPASDKDGLEKKRQEFLGHWKTLTKEMDAEGPFFLGKEPSLIDFVVAPWAMRLWIFDYYKGGLGIPEEGRGGEDEAVWRRFRTWLKAIEERPSIKNTMSEREYYLPLWQRYADDIAQSEMAKATREEGRTISMRRVPLNKMMG